MLKISQTTKIRDTIQNKECYSQIITPEDQDITPYTDAPAFQNPHAWTNISFGSDFNCMRDHRHLLKERKTSTNSPLSTPLSTIYYNYIIFNLNFTNFLFHIDDQQKIKVENIWSPTKRSEAKHKAFNNGFHIQKPINLQHNAEARCDLQRSN
jgi:hypothetical protein